MPIQPNKDFNLEWFTALNKQSNTVVNPPAVINGFIDLISSNIVTRVAGVSFKLIYEGNQSAIFEIAKISSLDYIGTNILIYSGNQQVSILGFVSQSETILAISRLETALNGGTV